MSPNIKITLISEATYADKHQHKCEQMQALSGINKYSIKLPLPLPISKIFTVITVCVVGDVEMIHQDLFVTKIKSNIYPF